MILFGYQKRKKKGDMATPEPTFPDNLAGFGYEFKDGKLKNIQTGEPFVFAVSPDDRDYNQKRYEALGELVQQDVYQLVKRECGMIKASVPINSRPGDPQTFVFLSSDFMTNDDKILIVIQGSGAVRAGQWSRKLTINEGIESGTQIPYIQIARREGYAVMVMNPNDNSRIVENQKQMIKGSESAVAHASYVWEAYLQESKAKHIAIVGHSYGGEVTKSLFDKYKEDFKQRVFAVALTSSTHTIADHTEYSDLIKISRHWQTSDQPLDTELPTMENGMKMVSAGTNTHERTSQACMESVFKFFQDRYLAFLEG
ncbi:cotranscriptional regulator FAM172A homolog [Penaeus monodon]|uniref:cotranscriptional regulator FAM172A homolog n=1 Tax=Penaeus monodon TaxID=6687 RepID=UPI0018A7BA34|nr:cotranscriptional regulator FAM172A homolog [Penaeus monodon]